MSRMRQSFQRKAQRLSNTVSRLQRIHSAIASYNPLYGLLKTQSPLRPPPFNKMFCYTMLSSHYTITSRLHMRALIRPRCQGIFMNSPTAQLNTTENCTSAHKTQYLFTRHNITTVSNNSVKQNQRWKKG